MKENEAEKGKEKEEEDEKLEDGYTLDNDPSGAQCSRPRKSNGRNHEKWQRYKGIFSLYYAENGDLKMSISYVHQGVKIGMILSSIRHKGHYVKDNPQRKQWLLERGVILTYDSGLCLSDTASAEKWQRYKGIFSHYYAENGDLTMPRSYECQGIKIGMILSNIRLQGSFVKDNPQRKQWLLERGVILTYDSGLCLSDTTSVEKWQRYKEIFSLYYAENGDLNMSQSYVYQGVKIGQILSQIRHNGNYVRDNAPRKLWLLEKGVLFTYDSLNSVSEEKWQRYKEIFSLYFAENGDLSIPARYEFEGIKIGKILTNIRLKGSFVKDDPTRKQWLLEKGVSFTYDSLNSSSEEKWQRYKEIFSLYYAEHGDLRMPDSYQYQGIKIGSILRNIRLQGIFVKDYPQRKQWLLERGVVLTYDSGLCLSDTTRAEKWHRYKEIFSLYYAEIGDLNMPRSYEHQGVKIGQILKNIRTKGNFVRDNAPRKLWLLEKGVSFTYE